MVDCTCKWSFVDLRDLTKKNQRFFKISFSNGEIGCRVLGIGKKNILVFHGFGQTSEDYRRMADAHPDYKFYILDLPFHGETKIADPSKPIVPKEITMIIDNLRKAESISRFSLLGCSIGAKLVYHVIEQYGPDLEEVMLFAPDGIRNNFWYRLATNSAVMRAVFKKIVRSDQLLPGLIAKSKKIKLVDSKTANLSLKSADSKEKREKVYHTWCYLRKLRLNEKKVAGILNDFSIKTIFVAGTRDKMIPLSAMIRLTSKLQDYQIVEIDAGHHNLINKYAEKVLDKRAVKR